MTLKKLEELFFKNRLRSFTTVGLLLLISAAAAYFNIFPGEFLGDDGPRIVKAKSILEQGPVAAMTQVIPDRPLLMLTIWLNYQMGQLDPSFYRLFNLLSHLLTSLALFALLQLLRRYHLKKVSPLYSLVLSLFFFLHPLHNQAINIIIQRGTILAGLFFFLGLIFYIQSIHLQRPSYLGGAITCYLLSLFFKPITIIFPLVVATYAYTFHSKKKAYQTTLIFLLATLPTLPLFLSSSNLASHIPLHVRSSLHWYEYLLIQSKVTLIYLGLYFFPLKIQYKYPLGEELDPLFNFIAPSLGFYALLIWLSLWAARKQRALLFPMLAYVFCLIPESSFFPIKDIIFIHRAYLSSAFLTIFLLMILGTWSRPRYLWLIILIFPFFIWKNIERNKISQNWISWNSDIVRTNPHDHFQNGHIFSALLLDGKYNEGKDLLWSTKLPTLYPDVFLYEFYESLFRLFGDGRKYWSEALSYLADYLRDQLNFPFDPYQRKKLNFFFYRELSKLVSPEEFNQKVLSLLENQKKVFSANPVYFQEELSLLKDLEEKVKNQK